MLVFCIVPLISDGTNFIFPIADGSVTLISFIVICVSHAEALLRWGVQVKGEVWWKKGRHGAEYNTEPNDWCLIILVVKAGVLKTVPFVSGIPLQPCLILFSSFKEWFNCWRPSTVLSIINVLHHFLLSEWTEKKLLLVSMDDS